MPKFINFGVDTTPVQVMRKQVFWMVEFSLPDSIKDELPFERSRKIEGRYLLGFYADPTLGDIVTWMDFEWRVVKRRINASRYNSRDKKIIPLLITEFLGESYAEPI